MINSIDPDTTTPTSCRDTKPQLDTKSPQAPNSCLDPKLQLVHVTEVRIRKTRFGHSSWSLKLVDNDGTHVAWDTLVWSDRGMGRVARALLELGAIHASSHLQASQLLSGAQLDPADLIGSGAYVETRLETHQGPDGQTVERRQVTYDGYSRCSDYDKTHALDGASPEELRRARQSDPSWIQSGIDSQRAAGGQL